MKPSLPLSCAFRSLIALLLGVHVLLAPASGKEKQPLNHDVYEDWKRISSQQISRDGEVVVYEVLPAQGDGVLEIFRTGKDGITVERGKSTRITADSKHVVCLVRPAKKELEKAKKKKGMKKGDGPKSKLHVVTVADGASVSIERMKSFRVPEEAGGWVAYLLEPPVKDEKEEEEEEKKEEEKKEEKKEEAGEKEKKDEKEKKKKKDKDKIGTELVIRNLGTGAEMKYPWVRQYGFTEDGKHLYYIASAEDETEDGVYLVEVETGKVRKVLDGPGEFKSITVDEAGKRFAVLSTRDDAEAKKPSWSLYVWAGEDETATLAAREGMKGVPEGWWVSEHRSPSFSKKGSRVFFGTAPRPEKEEEEEKEKEGEEDAEGDKEDDEEEKKPDVKVDIWHWKDPLLQPQQLVQLEQEKKRTYDAVYDFGKKTVVQLATREIPRVSVGSEGEADVAVGTSNLPYRMQMSWDWPGYNDIHVIDVTDGSSELVKERLQGSAQLSPESRFLTWWDPELRHWFSYSLKKKSVVNLTELLPHQVDNELHDHPMNPRSYGSAGWLEGDLAFLVYDRFDVWMTNPAGFWPPTCLTDGLGRKEKMRLRVLRMDPEKRFVPIGEPLLLSAFSEETKSAGFYRDVVRGTQTPERIYFAEERVSRPIKAKDSDAILLTRETYQRFPDLWLTDLDLKDPVRVSDANPQQADYHWGTSELVTWTSLDGTRLQGILCKPEGFDPKKKYPMMVYFYERNSDNLHQHVYPQPFRSIICRTFYTSRDYVVFVPDIPYKVGFPGQSAVNAVVPGITELVEQGFVDKDRIGVQGHSWGGYQIAYMVTKTDLFAAAEAGAPVSNMTSAYGGIRWGSGMSRMFQYEKTQSRIGGTLWNAFHRYVENSPLFWADQVKTPLMMMHNDKDGAVPWYQGIELFVALRRLGKPAWLINYNGEPHNLTKFENKKDWAIRMQQFFDHYLKDTPAPRWLAEGVPAIEKGKTLGLEIPEEETEMRLGSEGR